MARISVLLRSAARSVAAAERTPASDTATHDTSRADAADTGLPLSIVLLDLDHFKRVNDDYGHFAGDRVLEATAALLRRHLRPGDFAARFGGEELVLVLRHLPLRNASEVADRIRVALSTMPMPDLDLTITASFGVVAHDGHETAEALLARADVALYRAKHAGRNQVVADLDRAPADSAV